MAGVSKDDDLSDLDDLLADDEELFAEEGDDLPETAPTPVEAPAAKKAPTRKAPVAKTVAPVESEIARKIRELEEELAQPEISSQGEDFEKVELSADEQHLLELEDQLAARRGRAVENAPTQYDTATVGEKILIHILEDGFIAQGESWYRGQEIEFVVGSEAHKQTFDRVGFSWLELRDDLESQYRLYGKEMFRSGPWRGRGWGSDLDDSDSSARVAAKEARRNRAAPVVR